jgi:hypothetical protein
MPRASLTIRTASLAATLVVAWPFTALAQAPGASPAPTPFVAGGMCILDPAEAGRLMAVTDPMTAEPRYEGCVYSSDTLYLTLDWASYYDIDHEPDAPGEEVTVVGHPAWYDASSSTIYVDTGHRTYGIYATIGGTGATLDQLLPVTEAVIPRYVAQDEASPAFGLAALFPAELGGEPVDVSFRTSGPEWLANMSDDQRAQVQEMLATQGAAAEDLGIATGSTESGAQLSAFRMVGGSAAAFAEPLLTIAAGGDPGLTITPQVIAGKDVLLVSVPSEESTITVYPNGDIAWLMMMDDALVAEALSKLP